MKQPTITLKNVKHNEPKCSECGHPLKWHTNGMCVVGECKCHLVMPMDGPGYWANKKKCV